MTSIILWTLLAIDIVLVIMALVKVLLEELQPFKAMFWVMTIIFVPILGLVLFFFFGKNLHKKRLLSDRTHMLIAERIYQGFTAQDDLVIPTRHERVINFFARLTLAFPFKNNRIEILSEGSDFFLNLLHDIGQAQSHIHLITYIFTDDALGRLVADALIDKAREGVEVRVIYDTEMALRMKHLFLGDLAHCSPLDENYLFQHHTIHQRLADGVVRMFSPLM